MKRLLAGAALAIAVSAAISSGCSSTASTQEQTPRYAVNPDSINDLCLIYQGGSHRIDWTKEDFLPYVSHKFADGHRDWTFDGFLFLEIRDDVKQMIFEPGGVGGRYRNSTKEDWLWYLDRLFEPGKSLDALNSTISDLKTEIGEPGFRHKLVLTVLPPCPGEKNWGELDGRKLDFSNDNFEDMTAACKWFIDTLLNRYEQQSYENLDLVALYWLSEDVVRCKTLSSNVSSLVHDKGLNFYWIPYFKAEGFDQWKELGFDMAYHQPNYFFSKDIPTEQLDEACRLADSLGMGMEYEFDSSACYDRQESNHDRMQAYTDAFIRNGVWENASVAYYTGSYGLIDLDKGECPEDHTVTDSLAQIIVNRRK